MFKNKLAWEMRRCGIDATRAAWADYIREVSGRLSLDEWFAAQGYELSDSVTHAGGISRDGRPVIIDAQGRTWVMSAQEFIRQRDAAIAAAVSARKDKPPKQPAPGESLASVLCPVCFAVMAKSPICPNCSKGRSGYKILCACTECGHEVFL